MDSSDRLLKKTFSRIPDTINRLDCYTGLNNQNKNRYRDIIANDISRVKLVDIKNDYVNADNIKIDDFCYISTQSPLINTYRDFWKMVWDQNTHVIIMLTKFSEGQSDKYFKTSGEINFEYKASETNSNFPIIITVTMLTKEKLQLESGSYLSIRTFKLKHNNGPFERIVTHIQYKGWIDHKIPSSIKDIIILNDIMLDKMKDGVPVIHCSAGVGRAGTFIACSIIYRNNNKKDEIDYIITAMRKCRKGMVQSFEQYLYIHNFYKSLKNSE